MPTSSAGSDVGRVSSTIRALPMISLVLAVGLSVETLGAPWELRIDIPGATFQEVRGVSSNQQYAVGFFSTQQGSSQFFWRRGELSTFSLPGAETLLMDINARGEAIGMAFFRDTEGQMAFVRGQDGTVTPISCPPPVPISVRLTITPIAINNAGMVVGSQGEVDDIRFGFRWRNGLCEHLPVADGLVHATAVAENGIIVGVAGATDEFDRTYGFMIKGDGVFRVEHPEAPFAAGGLTSLRAVATNGLAVGWSSPSVGSWVNGDLRWFVYRDGAFHSIDVPVSPRDFNPLAISPAGVITYEGADDVLRAIHVR